MTTNLVALDVAVELAEALGPGLEGLKSKNKNLADQAKRALESVALNLAEGAAHHDGNRGRHFRQARASVAELAVALRLARAFRDLPAAEVARVWPLVDRLGALTFGLARRRE